MLDSTLYDPHSPKCVDDIVGNGESWKSLAGAITADKSANLILVGPSGCGKSLFLRFALAGRRVLNIECTANSGLRDVRDSIHFFACGAKTAGDHLRWVVFEHADMLTSDTQAFLRRMLETTVETTRFVFECRDIGAISEPILSRATIVNLSAPDDTELLYEIKRRTGFTIDAAVADQICALSYGNLRTAVLYALAFKHCGAEFVHAQVARLLSERPGVGSGVGDWVSWALKAEETCRCNGIDLRDVLRLGWPAHPIVNNTMSTWPRLGGTSPRTLFFDCIYQVACG
jgi:replication-associated recombination protein RarA